MQPEGKKKFKEKSQGGEREEGFKGSIPLQEKRGGETDGQETPSTKRETCRDDKRPEGRKYKRKGGPAYQGGAKPQKLSTKKDHSAGRVYSSSPKEGTTLQSENKKKKSARLSKRTPFEKFKDNKGRSSHPAKQESVTGSGTKRTSNRGGEEKKLFR